MPRPLVQAITLGDADRTTLTHWARRPKTAQALALRARIVLAAAEPGTTNTAITARLGVTMMTVTKWRNRFAARGLAGLHDEPRPGATRTITDVHVERVLTTTLESTPADATHWNTRRLATSLGLSQSAITRIWHAFGLQPHRVETFKLSRDPLFIDKVRDVVGLYLAPPDRALVLCVIEKPQIQATEGTTAILPLRPGQPEQQLLDYIRHGTRNLFVALDVQTGTVIGKLHHRHRSVDVRQFLDTVDANTPAELALHLVLDNSSIHKTPLIHRWLLRHPRVTLDFTPTSTSWLNLVECWFAILTKRRLARGAFRSTRVLEQAIKSYINTTNADAKPFVWTKTADEILDAVARLLPTNLRFTPLVMPRQADPRLTQCWPGCHVVIHSRTQGGNMATSPPMGPSRVGAVRDRSQVQNPNNGIWTKRNKENGQFMDQKVDGKPFKGVKKEKGPGK